MLVSPNLPIEAPVVLPHVANITTQRKPDNVFEAVVEGNNLVVHGLLAEGVDTNVHNNEGQSPLGLAIEHGWDTIARILIEKANLDVLDSCCCYQLRTPLMLAAERENEDIVRLLLDNGANVNMANFCGYTPLIFATEQGNEHIIRLLLERGADASQMDQSGNTQLLIAAARGRDNVMSLLLNGMADVNHTDHWGYTALMVAAFELKKGAVRLLLDKGADAEARNNKGFTALDLVNGHRKEDARIIIKQNARIIAIKDTRIIRKWLEERQPSSYIDHHNSYLQI